MKILTLCQMGNSRSVALSYLLKKKGHQSIAVGMLSSSRPTRRMLYEWADLIVLVIGDKYKHWIPEEFHSKLKVMDVGRDVFFRGYDYHLLKIFEDFIKKEGIKK